MLLQHLVTELYRSERSVKLTPAECTQLLRQASLVVAVDDAPADPVQIGYLLDVLPGCRRAPWTSSARRRSWGSA